MTPPPAARGEPAPLRWLGRLVQALCTAAMAPRSAGVLVSLVLIGWAVAMRYCSTARRSGSTTRSASCSWRS